MAVQESYLNNRWYDNESQIADILYFMQELPNYDQEELGLTLIQLVNILRKNRNEEETPISIGKHRVLGLYKASNKRRWYDKNSVLMSAMSVLSTLPVNDCNVIVDGIFLTLNEQGYDLESKNITNLD